MTTTQAQQLQAIYDNIITTSYEPLTFIGTGTASVTLGNEHSNAANISGTILNVQLPSKYTNLTINSKSNCTVTLENGLLTVVAKGSSGITSNYGNYISASYNITVTID